MSYHVYRLDGGTLDAMVIISPRPIAETIFLRWFQYRQTSKSPFPSPRSREDEFETYAAGTDPGVLIERGCRPNDG